MADSLASSSHDEPDRSQMMKERADRQPALLAIVSAVLTGAILSAALTTWVLWGIISGTWFWPWARASYPTPSVNPDLLAVIRVGLTVVAGAGGVVALVVAYRKQALAERDEAMAKRQEGRAEREEEATKVLRFVERFGAGASQLGDQATAVRLAGVYAMASLADEYPGRRQQCIDVLCAYLRLPYSPDPNDALLNQRLSDMTTTVDGTSTRGQCTNSVLPNDQHVRAAIVSVIEAHLQEAAPVSWSSQDFDFTGATLINVEFAGAKFCGTRTSFVGVTFSGEQTLFARATFSGGYSFNDATFSARRTSFVGTTFSGSTWFVGASFCGEVTLFDGATFSGGQTFFDRARFSGSIWFVGATFTRGVTSFEEGTFSGWITSFERATFSGKQTSFDRAKFSGELALFQGTTFSASQTSFFLTTFSGSQISLDGSSSSWAQTSFLGATFSGESTSFIDATFSGWATSFDGATFSAGRTSFDRITPGDTTVIDMKGIHVLDGATITRDGRDFRGWPDPAAKHLL